MSDDDKQCPRRLRLTVLYCVAGSTLRHQLIIDYCMQYANSEACWLGGPGSVSVMATTIWRSPMSRRCCSRRPGHCRPGLSAVRVSASILFVCVSDAPSISARRDDRKIGFPRSRSPTSGSRLLAGSPQPRSFCFRWRYR